MRCVIHMYVSVAESAGCAFDACVSGTLLAVEALWRLSCDLLLVKEDLQPRSLCRCLHSRQFLTATQHTNGHEGVESNNMYNKYHVMTKVLSFHICLAPLNKDKTI